MRALSSVFKLLGIGLTSGAVCVFDSHSVPKASSPSNGVKLNKQSCFLTQDKVRPSQPSMTSSANAMNGAEARRRPSYVYVLQSRCSCARLC